MRYTGPSELMAQRVTELLLAWGEGDQSALEQLIRSYTQSCGGLPVFSVDGTRLLIPYGHDGDRPGRVYVYDLANRTMKAITAEGVTGPAVLSPDGRFVAVNDASTVVIHTVDDGSTRTLAGSRNRQGGSVEHRRQVIVRRRAAGRSGTGVPPRPHKRRA
jgi:hypothetical protein